MFLYFEFSFMAGNLYFLLVSNLWNKFWWHNITRFKIYHQWFIKRFSFPETNWAFNWACLGASFCKFVPWNIPQTHLTNVLKLNRTWNFLISVASFLQLVNIPFSSIIITVLEKKISSISTYFSYVWKLIFDIGKRKHIMLKSFNSHLVKLSTSI